MQLQNNSNLRLNGAIKAPYFAGYSAAICSQIPYGMAVFGTYETLKTSAVKAFPEAPKLPIYLGCAVAGDMMGSLVLTPGEVRLLCLRSELDAVRSPEKLRKLTMGLTCRSSNRRFKRANTARYWPRFEPYFRNGAFQDSTRCAAPPCASSSCKLLQSSQNLSSKSLALIPKQLSDCRRVTVSDMSPLRRAFLASWQGTFPSGPSSCRSTRRSSRPTPPASATAGATRSRRRPPRSSAPAPG